MKICSLLWVCCARAAMILHPFLTGSDVLQQCRFYPEFLFTIRQALKLYNPQKAEEQKMVWQNVAGDLSSPQFWSLLCTVFTLSVYKLYTFSYCSSVVQRCRFYLVFLFTIGQVLKLHNPQKVEKRKMAWQNVAGDLSSRQFWSLLCTVFPLLSERGLVRFF